MERAARPELAELLRQMGRYDEAEPLYLRDLEASERTLGPEHPDTLTTVANDWWGVAGGVSVELTLIYLAPYANFYAQLPAGTRTAVLDGRRLPQAPRCP